MAICAYPQLIAAYHVFHRLLMPRHSPCALSNLTSLFQVLFSLELLQNYMSKCYLLFDIVVIHFHALPVLYVDNFLLDFLHYSVDNLHFEHLWMFVVEMRRIELLTPCLQGRCSPS